MEVEYSLGRDDLWAAHRYLLAKIMPWWLWLGLSTLGIGGALAVTLVNVPEEQRRPLLLMLIPASLLISAFYLLARLSAGAQAHKMCRDPKTAQLMEMQR